MFNGLGFAPVGARSQAGKLIFERNSAGFCLFKEEWRELFVGRSRNFSASMGAVSQRSERDD
jgi:hypothetical protein